MTKLEVFGDGFVLYSRYNRSFIYDLKESIPSVSRVWRDKDSISHPNTWWIDPDYLDKVISMVQTYYGDDLSYARTLQPASHQKFRGKIVVHYVGASRQRDAGEKGGFGLSDRNEWDIYFPDDTVESYFLGRPPTKPAEPKKPVGNLTLYNILGVPNTAGPDDLKSAWRKGVRQWHPDVCSEPNASEMFQKIQSAYEMLSDPIKRRKYDIALIDVQSQQQENHHNAYSGYNRYNRGGFRSLYNAVASYTPPMRSGVIDCDYETRLSRRIVRQIYSWDDVKDGLGNILVASWDQINKTVKKQWVQP